MFTSFCCEHAGLCDPSRTYTSPTWIKYGQKQSTDQGAKFNIPSKYPAT
ncbi:MAG: hypothetical protein CENE_01333 [Candidatus Celerinatantimonas neptuna]|nr:MAG: hypothetical protein CENE_01333 [Candidatus Celerinatantimonas neptuna]